MIQRKSSTEKKAAHTPSGYSWVMCCSFYKLKINRVITEEKKYMEMFCKDLRNLAMKIISYEKTEGRN